MKPFTKIIVLVGIAATLCYTYFRQPKSLVDENLPVLNTERTYQENEIPKREPIVQLYRNGKFYCTAFVIGNNYALTAGHCLYNDDITGKTNDELDIRLSNKTTGIKAKAVGINPRRDLGLIAGDFSSFNIIDIENDHPGIMANEPLIACGNPGGNKKVSCTLFTPAATDAFLFRGPGILMPGMSGGPVINIATNKAIGINIRVYASEEGGGVGISSLYGVLGTFGIEP